MIFGKSGTDVGVRNRIQLPEIEPEPPRTRPKSSSTIRPPSSSLRHQQQQNNRMLMTEYRERDNRLVEAKKKAVEIARERRKSKSNLSQLTPEDIKRRVRSRVTRASSSFLNPTKQSELRKTLTHLERLEMLSKQDLSRVAGASYETEGVEKSMPTSLMMINNLPSKGIPSWRKSSVGGSGVGEHF